MDSGYYEYLYTAYLTDLSTTSKCNALQSNFMLLCEAGGFAPAKLGKLCSYLLRLIVVECESQDVFYTYFFDLSQSGRGGYTFSGGEPDADGLFVTAYTAPSIKKCK